MFSSLDLLFAEGQRLDTVRQCAIRHHYRRLSEDLSAIAYGTFVAEFLREFLPEGEPEPYVYDLLGKIFLSFDWRNPRVTALAAVFQLMEYTGLQLRYERCVHCARAIDGNAFFSILEGGVLCRDCHARDAMPFPETLRNLILALRDFDWSDHSSLRLPAPLLIKAEQILLTHIERLLGHSMKSLDFIRQLD